MGAQVSLVDKDNVTVQHIAAFKGMPHLSEWLLYQGAFKNRLAMDAVEVSQALVPTAADAPPAERALGTQAKKIGDAAPQAPAPSRKPPVPQPVGAPPSSRAGVT